MERTLESGKLASSSHGRVLIAYQGLLYLFLAAIIEVPTVVSPVPRSYHSLVTPLTACYIKALLVRDLSREH